MLPTLRQSVLDANRALGNLGLAPFTFGNASAIDREQGLVVIKPSGVPYDAMKAEDLVITDLDGKVVEGKLKPSSDLPTHLMLYRDFHAIGGVVHTHSHFATAWAQARREIPCFGTTHADYFHGPIPVTEPLAAHEIASDYEANTGQAIVRRFMGVDPLEMPAVLVASHASFCWGPSVTEAVHTAAVLEEVARMAYHTITLDGSAQAIDDALHDKHFLRKHGPDAYYGQK
ncbi:MAG TPA: L-ribulose-5-phosphate 4-epimerase AraD [Gemmatimonadaceae bacterium]|nr:L-ribulose-5-phosphate 4-epimerase AraD [Gemmatimonadaceae bacterium]